MANAPSMSSLADLQVRSPAPVVLNFFYNTHYSKAWASLFLPNFADGET